MQGGKIMKKDNRQERLKAIKLRYVVFPTECKICGKKHKFEKMWKFQRYYINKEVVNWHFCQDCISSAKLPPILHNCPQTSYLSHYTQMT